MFSKKPQESPQAMASKTASTATGFSVLGADTAIKGDITGASDIHIDGRIEGDITCASLVQGETSEIIGVVTADSARLAGTMRGSITAKALVILKTAKIHGDVHYDSLTIEQGAQVDGRFAPRGAAVLEPAMVSKDSEPLLTLAG